MIPSDTPTPTTTFEKLEFPVQPSGTVICGGCANPKRPRDMKNFRGKRRCIDCVKAVMDEERDAKDSEEVMDAVRTLVMRRLDIDRFRASGEREPPDPTVALDAFYDHFGGSNEFGIVWAKVVRKAADRAMQEGVGSVQAAKMMLDVYRATVSTNNSYQQRDIERMSLEEAEAERRRVIALELAAIAKDSVNSDLMGVIRALINREDTDGATVDGFLSDLRLTLDSMPAPADESKEVPDATD